MSKSLLKSRFWQILLYCKAFSVFCGKCQAAAAIWQFAACHKNVYGTRNLTPDYDVVRESREGPIAPAGAHFVRMEKAEEGWGTEGPTKICNSCNFHGKFAAPKEQSKHTHPLALAHEGHRLRAHSIVCMCIRICALNVKIFVCLAFQALNFCCQRSTQKTLSLGVLSATPTDAERYF